MEPYQNLFRDLGRLRFSSFSPRKWTACNAFVLDGFITNPHWLGVISMISRSHWSKIRYLQSTAGEPNWSLQGVVNYIALMLHLSTKLAITSDVLLSDLLNWWAAGPINTRIFQDSFEISPAAHPFIILPTAVTTYLYATDRAEPCFRWGIGHRWVVKFKRKNLFKVLALLAEDLRIRCSSLASSVLDLMEVTYIPVAAAARR